MFFKDDDEKNKFLAQQEKDKKRYEKIEKKLFTDINQVILEVEKNPIEDLRVVLFSNKDDLCKSYFDTLSESAEDEENFIKVFNFVFNDTNKLIELRGARMLLDDFKLYMNVAIDNRYVLGIDAVISYFENKINVANPLNFMLMTSLEQDNYALLEFLFLKTGEKGKKSKYEITENVFFADVKNLSSIINYKSLVGANQTIVDKVFSVKAYKKIAFEKDEFINIFVSKIKVFLQEAQEVKSSAGFNVLMKKSFKILDIFYGMDESTINKLIYNLENKKEAGVFFSFFSTYNKLLGCTNETYDSYSKQNTSFFDFYLEGNQEKIEKQCFYVQKTFLEFANNDKKIELINNAFLNISRKYEPYEIEELKKFERKKLLSNKLDEPKYNDDKIFNIDTKKIKKKI